jgi:aryl-phospho-beta-D-glucosidase BglC (GH1 family)
LALRDDRFIRATDGATVHIKAANWFGFNNGQTMLDGLYSSGSAAATDMASITWQLRLLGFNGVRLPFLFDDVLRRAPRNTTFLSYCDPTTPRELAERAVDPEAPADGKQRASESQPVPVPPVPLPPAGGDTRCNTYLPWTSTLDRFLWVVQWFAANGFYVLLDYHPMGQEYTSYSTEAFVGNWTQLWRAVSCLPNFESGLRGRVFVDLLNEPDSIGQRWERTNPWGNNGEAEGLKEIYLSAMDALWRITPGAPLFFVEGGGQTGLRGVNWGNGFATDRALIAERKLSDPNPFFEALMRKPYRASVVISPHVYGPSVTSATDTYSGPSFIKMLDTSFGYLSKKGYCLPAVAARSGRALLDAEDEAALLAAEAAEAEAVVAAEAEAQAQADETMVEEAMAAVGGAEAAAGGGANATEPVAVVAVDGDGGGSNSSSSSSSSTSGDDNNNAADAEPQEQPQQPPPLSAPPSSPPALVRDCQRFPVAIGEFGSRFETKEDLEHLNDFAAYLNNEGVGRTDQHNAISSVYYWSYNPNSWDTGGLVDDSWQNLLWQKLRFLRQKLGMRAWYQQSEEGAGGGGGGGGTAEDRARRAEAEQADREWWEAGGWEEGAAAAAPRRADEGTADTAVV